MNNSWVHQGIEYTVSTYYTELKDSQDKNFYHGIVKIGSLVIDDGKFHDFELGLFQCNILECKHNASDWQYLGKYHWIDIEIEPKQ